MYSVLPWGRCPQGGGGLQEKSQVAKAPVRKWNVDRNLTKFIIKNLQTITK
jgi:hypothetical protein